MPDYTYEEVDLFVMRYHYFTYGGISPIETYRHALLNKKSPVECLEAYVTSHRIKCVCDVFLKVIHGE
jgi:hypothetical protein